MEKFKSKPHIIEAFQFTDSKIKPPQWFLDAEEVNKAQVTVNGDDMYIVIYGHRQIEKAKQGDWVCFNGEKIYVLDNERFEENYEKNS